MKSLKVGELRAEIKILHFLQMGEIRAILFLLSHAPSTLKQIATTCAVCASKLLLYAQCAQANCYHKRSVRQQIPNTILRDFTQFDAICYRMRSVR
jgi:hypothetical protein